jgi:hypothetical protein
VRTLRTVLVLPAAEVIHREIALIQRDVVHPPRGTSSGGG